MLKDLLLIPNLVSLLRVIAAPFLFILLSNREPLLAGPLLILVGVVIASDFFDGILARRLNQTSRLGLILDPLGDKACLIATVLGLLLSERISPALFGVLIGKDLLILLGAGLLIGKTRGLVPSNPLGKWTTALLACGLAGLGLGEILAGTGDLFELWLALSRIAVLLGSLLAILSLADYGLIFAGRYDKHPSRGLVYALAGGLGIGLIILILSASGIESLAALPPPWL